MGDAGCNIIFGAIMLLLTTFIRIFFGLVPCTGWIFTPVRTRRDAITDPIMGAITDRPQQMWPVSSMAAGGFFP